MINYSFLDDRRVRALRKFNERYSFAMVLIFSLIPLIAMLSPQSFGPIFSGISKLEIAAFIALGLFQLVSFATFSSRTVSTSSRMKVLAKQTYDSFLRNKAGILLLAVYIISIISACLAKDTQRSFNGTDFRPDGILMYTAFGIVFVFSSIIKDKQYKRIIFVANIISFVLISLVMIQQYFGIIGSAGVKDAGAFGRYLSSVYDSWGIRFGHFYKGMTGSFYNLNHFAYYITVCALLISGLYIKAQKTSSKIIFGILCAFSYMVIIMNDTFGCYLAILAALVIVPVIMIIKSRPLTVKKVLNPLVPLVIFICISLVFFIADPDGNSISRNFRVLGDDVKKVATSDNLEEEHAGSGRLEMWLATVDMIQEKPLLGYGPDNLKAHYVEREVTLDRAHNEPLERAVATGIPSAIIYYAAIGYALYLFLKNKSYNEDSERYIAFMAVIGYLVSSLFGVQLFYTGGYFFIMLAFATSSEGYRRIASTDAKSTKKR